ncbi:high-affinity nickel-transport protein [Arthrobacter silviterrae]|uniref:Nickel/cobalt efflux system n=1 Tax=Arthrobacter silviterrae TaxID=2026658 RepID=A0ABX0DBK1_9MICC|nr:MULTISPECIES: nickel transporter [Arthrobacter]MCU6482057.1 nickel transporter [Arthrobacter sp. A2-55]MDQ0276070.1 high-affinity nickel-transport protein [Arthrobacter silviterrae]NGN84298.1 nickel transporter [Arthrobacter silviterrae]
MTAPARLGYLEREKLPLARRVGATFLAVAVLHAVVAGLMVFSLMTDVHPLAFGLVVTAYLAGVKHSYDWDHIAAIDNSSRKFASQGRAPVSVGFAFSLGHSSVVMVAGVLVVSGAGIMGAVLHQGSAPNVALALFGSSVSALFLLAIGLFNGSAFLKANELFRRIRGGGAVADDELAPTGMVARLLDKPLSRVKRPRDIYVLGFLFGLGFDTASTIAFLLLTASAALAGVSVAALLALPLAFTAAMTLCDTANGMAMMKMYRSAVMHPARRIGFNMVITGLSATSALFISALTIAAIVHEVLGLSDPVTTWLATVDLGHAGLLLVGLFLAVWGIAALGWRKGRQ